MFRQARPSGLVGFSVVWLGQIISVLASGMTAFAFTIYMYQQTKSATAMGFVQVSFVTPLLLLSPVAGVMVDRYNRKTMMMISDIGGGLASLIALILFATGHLQFWHVYVVSAVKGAGSAFQWPAYSAAISTMIPKEQYARANGMMSLVEAGPGVVSPLLGGALLPFIGLSGILILDVLTFAVALLALALVLVPQPVRSAEGERVRGSFLSEAAFGFQYIFARPSLLGLQLIFSFANLFSGMAQVVVPAMILARTAQNSILLGSVQSAASVGVLIGGIAMSAWGGFRRRVHGVLAGWVLCAVFGDIAFSLGHSLPIWAPMLLVSGLFVPLINGSNQAIWQAKVAPDLQGRVFSSRRLIAWLSTPIAPILGGALADFILEPALRAPSTPLAARLGTFFGSGSGSGMCLLIFLCGFGILLVALCGYSIRSIREAEALLPDYDERLAAETTLVA